jgi:hypothetical protein
VTEDIGSCDVQSVKNGDDVVGAVQRGILARLVGLAAPAVTATIDENKSAAASLKTLDIPDLAPDLMALRETVQQDERSAISNDLISDPRSVSGDYVHHLVLLRSMPHI